MGFGELVVVLVIVLVLFGAKRVPEIGASVGKGIREFRRGINDADRQIREADRPTTSGRTDAVETAAVRAPEETTVREEPKRLM